MEKKALSAIISTLILIIMVLVATTTVWIFVKKNVNGNLEQAKTCYDILGKIKLNSEYTCYDRVSQATHFSIEVGNITLDKLLVGLKTEDDSVVYTLTNQEQTIPGLKNYDNTDQVKLPDKNSESTFISTGLTTEPTTIEIAPIINNKNCDIIDSISDIGFC